MTAAADYETLAYELYQAADDLVEGLVAIREARGMNVHELAQEMSVDEKTIIGIEDGSIDPTLQLLVDYALETGARFHIRVNKAESDKVTSDIRPRTRPENCVAEWRDGDIAMVRIVMPVNEKNETPAKMHIIEDKTRSGFTVSTTRNLNTLETVKC